MMNETLKERISSGFTNMGVMHKIFADKLDLVNDKLAFLEKKYDLVNDKWAFLEKKHDTLEHKVSDPQVSHIFPREQFCFLINLKLCQLQDWSYYIFIFVLAFLCFLQIYAFMKHKQI